MKRIRAFPAIHVAAALSAIVGISFISPVEAAPDTTPPTLNAPIKASFTVGGQLTLGYHPDCSSDPDEVWADLPATFKWRGTDNAGAVRYTLEQNTGVNGQEEVFTGSTQTTYHTSSDNSSQACGGGNHTVYEWNLTATDTAGNSTTKNVYGGRMRLTQDHNLVDHDDYAPAAIISYAGTWQLASCQCWSQGGVHKIQAKGASAQIRFDDTEGFGHPQYPMHVGLIMHTGPDRGKFQVYLNGVLKGTVDTFARVSKPRVMVWQISVPEEGSVIKIVNQATAGRPRIDLDAVVTN
jgi:hypothetical protein